MDLTQFLVAWRTTGLQDREVVDALVHPAHAGPSPELAAVLARWRGHYYWSDEPDGRHLILTRRHAAPRRERWWLHALLLLATLATTTLVGAVIAGTIPPPFEDRLAFIWRWPPGATLRDLVPGLGFSLPLLAILLAHELGHYVTARRYLLDVSPPFFIPLPVIPSFGTMGAFIRLRTMLSDRRQLLDVGLAGPIAGFLVALPILVVGFRLSHYIPATEGLRGLVLQFGTTPVATLGDSAVTWLVRHWLLGSSAPVAVAVHPVAFAGCVGMFVTTLNLFPMAQLDGGHVLYAALPRWQGRVARGFWFLLAALGYYWRGWLYWAVLVLLLSRGSLTHPPVLDAYRPLPPSRRGFAWGAFLLFLLTFAPIPF